MAVDKPTEKAQEAIAESARLAGDRGNQAVEPEHLLLALLDAREGVVEPVLQRAGADLPGLRAATVAAIDRRAQVSGAAAGAQVSNPFRQVLRRAGQEAERLDDEYISTEHLLLALLEEPSPAARGDARERRHPRRPAGRAAGGARLGAGHRPQPRGQVPGAGAVRARPHRRGRAREARPGDRPRRGDPPGDPGALAPHQEQPGADRRARHRQDRDRRGPGPAHRDRRHPRGPGRQAGGGARRRRAAGGRQVPRRVRGPPQGGAEGDRGRRRPGDPVHRRAAHDRRRRRRRGRGRRGQPAQADAGARRAARGRAPRRSTSTASTSRRTRPWSGASSR